MSDALAFARYVEIAARLRPEPKQAPTSRAGQYREQLAECNRGHAMQGFNVRVTVDGKRKCKACERLRSRARRAAGRPA